MGRSENVLERLPDIHLIVAAGKKGGVIYVDPFRYRRATSRSASKSGGSDGDGPVEPLGGGPINSPIPTALITVIFPTQESHLS